MQDLIKAVIFDLDGVIIDSNPAIETFWKSWTDRESIELTDALIREWIHGRKVGDTLNGLFQHLPDKRKKEIEQSAYDFDREMRPGAIPGLIDFIQTINSLNILTGVVTSSHYERMMKLLINLGLEKKFTRFITANDVTQGKPHPEPYQKMREKMNLPKQHCLVFEDAVSGIQSAKAAGMQVIGIGNETAKQQLLHYGASAVTDDFSDIRVHQHELSVSGKPIFHLYP